MNNNQILNSKEYKDFLLKHLTEGQQDTMLLKYQILTAVNDMKLYNKPMTDIYKEVSANGFIRSNGEKMFVSKRTVKKYYLELRKTED